MQSLAATTSLFPIPTALVVGADRDTRELYSLMLSDVAHDIQQVDDGRIALARALAEPPSLLVTDTHVPFIDGCALCRLLRDDPATARVLIVVTTSDGGPASIQRARAAGANVVLVTPLLIEAFISSIRGLIETQGYSLEKSGSATRQALRSNPVLALPGFTACRRKSRAYERYATATPPRRPPVLRCPSCDRVLRYLRSHIGGVNSNQAEQWDHFDCPAGCSSFDYRHRTRKLCRKP